MSACAGTPVAEAVPAGHTQWYDGGTRRVYVERRGSEGPAFPSTTPRALRKQRKRLPERGTISGATMTPPSTNAPPRGRSTVGSRPGPALDRRAGRSPPRCRTHIPLQHVAAGRLGGRTARRYAPTRGGRPPPRFFSSREPIQACGKILKDALRHRHRKTSRLRDAHTHRDTLGRSDDGVTDGSDAPARWSGFVGSILRAPTQ
jgi:hypothetical protein